MRLAILLCCVSFLPAAAQVVEWESLDGPYSGFGGILVGDADGVVYRAENRDGVGEIWRTTDGLSWELTAYPGSPVHSVRIGGDGSLLVATGAEVFVGSGSGETWTTAGIVVQDVERVTRDATGRLFALVGTSSTCQIRWSDDDGQTWHVLDNHEAVFVCGSRIITSGSWLIVAQLPTGYPTLMKWTNDMGATWQSGTPGGVVSRFIRGQHGGTFAVAHRVPGMFIGFLPYLHRFQGGGWQTLVGDDIGGVTTRADGTLVIGFADGRFQGAEDLRIANPRHLAETASGALLASTSGAGRWRHAPDDGWRQSDGSESRVRSLAFHAQPYAGVGKNALRHDGERWRPTGWTRNDPHALAFHGDDLWIATAGPVTWPGSGRGGQVAYEPEIGVWKSDSSAAFEIAELCDAGICSVPALVISGDIALASHLYADYWDFIGDGVGVVRTADGGQSWETVIPDVAGVCHLAGDAQRGFIAARGACLGKGPPGEAFYRSFDAGLTWQAVTEGLPGERMQSVAVGADGAAYVGIREEGTFRLDAGSSVWMPMGPTGTDFSSLDVNVAGQVVAAVDGALRVYDGTNWGWPPAPAAGVYAVRLDGAGLLYVATADGLFRSTQRFVVSTEEGSVRDASALESIHPNPARGEATATFRLAEAGTVEIAMYDLLGRRVAVLAGGEYAGGSHAIRFGVAGLAAGVYVLELRAGGERWARRITVIDPF